MTSGGVTLKNLNLHLGKFQEILNKEKTRDKNSNMRYTSEIWFHSGL